MKTFPRFLALLLVIASWLYASSPANAQALATSDIHFRNLSISPAAGSLDFGGSPWLATSFTQAQNSAGELDAHFDSSIGGVASTDSHVTFAASTSALDAAGLVGDASSLVNIPLCIDFQALAIGRGDLSNTFTVTGGVGAVDVTFSADVFGSLLVSTGPCGVLARTDTTFSLQVFGLDANGDPIANPVLFRFDLLEVDGPDQSAAFQFTDHLSTTVSLAYSNEYFVFVLLDSQSEGITTVPEPSMLASMAIGIGGLKIFLRKRRHPKSKGR